MSGFLKYTRKRCARTSKANMPCPYFEPDQVIPHPEHSNARLPLIDEYQGRCRASDIPIPAPPALRFQYCNQGNSRGCCDLFPVHEARSALRYTVARRTETTLEVVCVEEKDYAPLRWYPVQYFFENELLAPDIPDLCTRAQVLGFCRSYLARFSDGPLTSTHNAEC